MSRRNGMVAVVLVASIAFAACTDGSAAGDNRSTGAAAAPFPSADQLAVPEPSGPAVAGAPVDEGTLPTTVDPWSVYDPVRGGESVPMGFLPVLARDDIPPVYDPTFVEASVVDWTDDSLVIGVDINDEARAYPVAFLTRREMVIDNHRGTPTLVTWCPLCGTAMVHRREVDGEAVVFGNQGALFGNAMTWWDHDTGSIWSQPLGEAIMGPRKGETLELLTSTIVRWGDWRGSHPDTLALDAPNGDIGRTLDDLVIVVELGGESVAFPISTLRQVGVANEYVGGTPVAVVALADTGQWEVFARQLDDRVVQLELVDGQLLDLESGVRFDPVLGRSSTGGQALRRLPSFSSFPDDYPTFFPDGQVWTVDGLVQVVLEPGG